MNPHPHHEVKEHVEYQGRKWVVTDRAPNADGWRLTLHPGDLSGPEVHVSDDDTAVHTLLRGAGLDPDVFDEEQAKAEASEEQARAESAKALRIHHATAAALEALGMWHHGFLSEPELHATYIAFAEASR